MPFGKGTAASVIAIHGLFGAGGFAPNSNPSLAPTVRKLLRNAGNVTYEHERESDLAQFAAQGKEEMHNEATKRTSELAKKIDEMEAAHADEVARLQGELNKSKGREEALQGVIAQWMSVQGVQRVHARS